MSAHYSRVFTGGSEQLREIRDFAKKCIDELEVLGDDNTACRLVLEEAASNALQHSYDGNEGRIEVNIWREDDDIFLSVRNWGRPFDPHALSEPDINKPLHMRAPGGLGVYLIRQFTDSTEFSFDAAEGNTIVMRRKLRHKAGQAEEAD